MVLGPLPTPLLLRLLASACCSHLPAHTCLLTHTCPLPLLQVGVHYDPMIAKLICRWGAGPAAQTGHELAHAKILPRFRGPHTSCTPPAHLRHMHARKLGPAVSVPLPLCSTATAPTAAPNPPSSPSAQRPRQGDSPAQPPCLLGTAPGAEWCPWAAWHGGLLRHRAMGWVQGAAPCTLLAHAPALEGHCGFRV